MVVLASARRTPWFLGLFAIHVTRPLKLDCVQSDPASRSMHKVIAIYPGSFDPPTNGHLDLIDRGSKIFDELVVAILRNAEKAPLFTVSERVGMLEALTAAYSNVRVDTFDGLTVDYAVKVGASSLLRGIRALTDYEYELQMALMNRKLRPELETVFMMPAEKYSYLSSRLVREVAQLGGSVKGLVPEMVEQNLKGKLDPAYKLAEFTVPEDMKSEKRKSKARKKS
jgi:pantetheine-phosphate adenylyltransferase